MRQLSNKFHYDALTMINFVVIFPGMKFEFEKVGPIFPCFNSLSILSWPFVATDDRKQFQCLVLNNKIWPLCLAFNWCEKVFAFQKATHCWVGLVEYASIPSYLNELIESVQRKALKIIFGRVDYTEALVLAGLESLSDRRVGACKRFMATARQMSPLQNIIPSPAAIESHYSIKVQLPRRQHGHTRSD